MYGLLPVLAVVVGVFEKGMLTHEITQLDSSAKISASPSLSLFEKGLTCLAWNSVFHTHQQA